MGQFGQEGAEGRDDGRLVPGGDSGFVHEDGAGDRVEGGVGQVRVALLRGQGQQGVDGSDPRRADEVDGADGG
jgi:hypothetical protein